MHLMAEFSVLVVEIIVLNISGLHDYPEKKKFFFQSLCQKWYISLSDFLYSYGHYESYNDLPQPPVHSLLGSPEQHLFPVSTTHIGHHGRYSCKFWLK